MNTNIIKSILKASVACLAFSFITSCSDDDYDSHDFSYLNQYEAPTMTSFSPLDAFPSSVVTIKGSNFGSVRTEGNFVGRVFFSGVEAAEYVSWSNTEIQVRVPDGIQSGKITVWCWKNSAESQEIFTPIPGAEILSINPNPAFPGADIDLQAKNLQSFIDKGVSAKDVKVTFQTEEGPLDVAASAISPNSIAVTIPVNAKGGSLTVDLGGLQTVTTPSLELVGDYHFAFLDVIETGGSIKVADGCIDSTKDGAYAIYKFTAPASGLFELTSYAATMKDGSALNINISENLNSLKVAPLDDRLTKEIENKGNWNDDTKATYGPFKLQQGTEYYLKITFITTSGSWCANLHKLDLNLCKDQSQTPIN